LPQVNKLRRIVVASVLKPVDETRMFEKFGLSLANQGQFEVHIIGFPAKVFPAKPDQIYFYPISSQPFKRLSWQRAAAPWKILRKIITLQPEAVILTTHELLLIAAFARLIIRCRLIYDVQENYFRNILYTHAFPFGIRQVLAICVRLKEIVLSPIIHHFILAEKGYVQELRFARPSIVLQNKVTKSIADTYRKSAGSGYTHILFTGTLAQSTGVFEAIEIVRGLHEVDPAFHLSILGCCASQKEFNRLTNLAQQHTFLSFKGKTQPIPHHEILVAISQADFGIVYYPQNPATLCSIPTKVFEYTALNLPVLIRHNEESHHLILNTHAGIVLSEPINFMELADKMKKFDVSPANPSYWESDFPRLLGILNK
jgi:hypothetical protein